MRFVPVPGVFTPHSDSWMLADLLRRETLPPGAHVLDLCTGSGVLALTAAQHHDRKVVAVDVSRRAVCAVRVNARLNGVRVDVRRGDLYAAAPGRFDLIVSNPPYLPGDSLPRRGASRAWEGGPGGRVLIDRICLGAADHLSPGGVLLMVHSEVSGERQTLHVLAETGLQAEVVRRHRGPLGPRLRERAGELRAQGLLRDEHEEEMVFFRAQRVAAP